MYLRFDGVGAAMKAQNSLHGRWFAGKMITATYMVKVKFHFDVFFGIFNVGLIIKLLILRFTDSSAV